MKYAIFIVLVLATIARAEIRLVQIAEFPVPLASGHWDVQHWMDDSTFGIVQIGNNALLYETRIGEGMQTISFGDSMCDATGGGGHAFTLKRVCIVKGADNVIRFAVACSVEPWASSGLATILLLDPSGNDTCFHFPNDRMIAGYAGLQPNSCYAWPPPPNPTQKVVVSLGRYECVDSGNFYCEYSYRTVVVNVVTPGLELNIPDMINMRPFQGAVEFDAALAGLRINLSDDDISPFDFNWRYTWNMLGTYSSGILNVDTTCYQYVEFDPADGFLNICSNHFRLVTAQDTSGERRVFVSAKHEVNDSVYVNGMACYDFENRELLWETGDFESDFAICPYPSIGTVLCEPHFGNGQSKLYFRSLEDGHVVDSTQFFAGGFQYTMDTDSCDPKIVAVTQVGTSRTIHIYRVSYPPTELTITIAPIGGQVILRWNQIPYATGYSICRAREYDDNLCDDNQYWTTDTTMILTPNVGMQKEFFTVNPIFD